VWHISNKIKNKKFSAACELWMGSAVLQVEKALFLGLFWLLKKN